MIKFGTQELTDIAPVKIEDITVSPIQLNPIARQRAIDWGAEFVRMGAGTRTITISFALLEASYTDREEAMQNIRDWCKAGNNKEYTLDLPQYENRHLECVCTKMPEYSYRKWWENKLKIVFTCYDNLYWTSNELIEVPCGTYFSVGGSAPPQMKITRRGATALTNQTYSNGTSAMTFSTIPAGELVIDLNRQTAAIGSSTIMRYYTPLSNWIIPKVGANQIITGSGTVQYRERWV